MVGWMECVPVCVFVCCVCPLVSCNALGRRCQSSKKWAGFESISCHDLTVDVDVLYIPSGITF